MNSALHYTSICGLSYSVTVTEKGGCDGIGWEAPYIVTHTMGGANEQPVVTTAGLTRRSRTPACGALTIRLRCTYLIIILHIYISKYGVVFLGFIYRT